VTVAHQAKTHRSFLCADDLWIAFAKRAKGLECSVDWLVCEAMKRLLESGPGHQHQTVEAKRSAPPPLPKPSLPPPPRPPRVRSLGFAIDGKPMSLEAYERLSSFVIGRSVKEAQLVLRDPGVSRQHAMVERGGNGGLVIVDMASTNGVIINGHRVARAALHAGDRIEIGPFTIDVV